MLSTSDQIRLDQSLSPVQLFVTPWITARQASLSITNSRSSPKLMPIESVMPSSHLILCRPLLLLPSIIPASETFPMSHFYASDQISRSVMSDSLRPHESQHARPPCPSPTPGVHPNSCLSSWWCHPAISPSVVPFSSCPQIPPSIRVFSNESTLRLRWPKYQDQSPLEWTVWISLQSKGLSRVFSNTTVQNCWLLNNKSAFQVTLLYSTLKILV